jgi:hypothetical protein
VKIGENTHEQQLIYFTKNIWLVEQWWVDGQDQIAAAAESKKSNDSNFLVQIIWFPDWFLVRKQPYS